MSSEIDDAMLKTLVYSGKPNYGFGSIAGMVKPSHVCMVADKERAMITIKITR